MNEFFDRFEEIRDAVRTRLTAATTADLPVDGTAGPRPFDIEPVEKWLYEAYTRHYKKDENRSSAFWVGLAGALETALPPTSEMQGRCIQHCADLMDQIANNHGIQSIKKEPFARVNEVLATRRDSPAALGEVDILPVQASMLRIALLSSMNIASGAVLQTEQDLWTTIHRRLALKAGDISVMRAADTLCVLFRAWAVLGRRNVNLQPIVRQWCQSGTVDKDRLASYMKRTRSLLNLSSARYDDAIWHSLEACVTGQPSVPSGSLSGVPRYSRRVELGVASVLSAP